MSFSLRPRGRVFRLELAHPDQRPRLASVMCWFCRHAWLRGRQVWHAECLVDLRHAFDQHFERLHDVP